MTRDEIERLVLSGEWTSEFAFICSRRCADEFGDPPCWSLAGEQRMGSTPIAIDPCDECRQQLKDMDR